MTTLELLQTHSTLLLSLAGIFGLVIGSFLNVVIHRLPVMMQQQWQQDAPEAPIEAPFNLMQPASHCPHCQHRIRAWENIPVISYLLLRGRCSQCQAAIGVRYPLVELSAALLAIAAFAGLGANFNALAITVFFWVLLVLSLIDFDHQLLPDSLTLPLLWAGLLLNLSNSFVPLTDAVIGAAAGYLSLWSLYWAFRLLTGKEGMGYGDFKLFAAFGAWFGWMALPLIILLASVVGAITGLSLIALQGRDRQLPIPFGPYLCAAALVYVFYGERLTLWYLGTL